MLPKQYFVYILTTRPYGVLYVGVTSDLIKRMYEHKNNLVEGFTSKYNIHTLVYFEASNLIEVAINREKTLKRWKRQWKLELINSSNPEWKDLYPTIIG